MSNLEQIGINGTDYDLADAYMREHGALQDGYYEGMSVGNADQLMSAMFLTEQEPFLFRTTGGALEVGNREYLELNGGSVAWNQLVQSVHATQTKNDITATNNGDGSITLSGKATAITLIELTATSQIPYKENHVYMLGKGTNYQFYDGYGADGYNIVKYGRTSGSGHVYARIENGVTVNEKIYPKAIDLTQMFGSTIADYIYALERNTAGAGVAWFKKLFPADYYAYNAGELIHVNASAFKTTGFNQFDVSTGKAKLLGGHEYEIVGTYSSLSYSTGETITPVSGKFTPSANGELTVTGGDSTTCVHLVWDGERDGEYEAYSEHSYALDSDLVLRGIPKLDASNNLYFDGDTYQSDGTVTRKYGIVDLGNQTWSKNSTYGYMYTTISGIKRSSGWNSAPDYIRCPLYLSDTANNVTSGTTDKRMSISPNADTFYVYDSAYTDKDTFKTAMSGVYLVYELATSTTESADPFTSPMICDNWGTEEFVVTAQSGVEMPVGHTTKYPPDLKAKLEVAPESPDADGLYLMKHENGANSYIEYISPLPGDPATDGTYVLKATKSGSTVTLSWVAES